MLGGKRGGIVYEKERARGGNFTVKELLVYNADLAFLKAAAVSPYTTYTNIQQGGEHSEIQQQCD